MNSPRLLVPSRMHSVTDSVEVQLNMKSSVKTCLFSAVLISIFSYFMVSGFIVLCHVAGVIQL